MASRLDVSPEYLERGAALYLCSHKTSVHLARTSASNSNMAPKRQRAALGAASALESRVFSMSIKLCSLCSTYSNCTVCGLTACTAGQEPT